MPQREQKNAFSGGQEKAVLKRGHKPGCTVIVRDKTGRGQHSPPGKRQAAPRSGTIMGMAAYCALRPPLVREPDGKRVTGSVEKSCPCLQPLQKVPFSRTDRAASAEPRWQGHTDRPVPTELHRRAPHQSAAGAGAYLPHFIVNWGNKTFYSSLSLRTVYYLHLKSNGCRV